MDELLREKPDIVPHDVWEKIQATLLEGFLHRRGIHFDELDSYNSYLPQMLELIKEAGVVHYVDDEDVLHQLTLKDLQFIRPFEKGVGFDDPERAMLRQHYEAEVRGSVVYRRWEKSANDMKVEDSAPLKEDQDDEGNEEQKDPDDPEEEDEEDDEEEQKDPDDPEDDPEEEDNEEDEGDEEEEQKDPDDPDEEDDEEESEQKEEVETKGDPAPDATRPAFYYENEKDYSMYDVEVYQMVKENHLILVIPVWGRSDLCHMATPVTPLRHFQHTYLMGYSYIVSRNFKLCPYEEYYINNRLMIMKPDFIETRCRFFHRSRRFRTNSTLKFEVEYPKNRSIKLLGDWTQHPRFMVHLPHEKKKIPLTVLMMAFGWSVDDFCAAVRMFLGIREPTPEMASYFRMLRQDNQGCTTQRQAILKLGEGLDKYYKMKSEGKSLDEISSYISFTLRGEYIPNLVDPDVEDHEWENLRKGYYLAEVAAEFIRLAPEVNDTLPDHEKWRVPDHRSYVWRRLSTPGEKMTELVRKYVKQYVKRATDQLTKDLTDRKTPDLHVLLNHKNIKLTQSVKNGVWDVKADAGDHLKNKTQMMIMGFCEDTFHRQTQLIRKAGSSRNTDPRPWITHPSHMGRSDLYVTPESEKCGQLRNKALGAVITPLIDYAQVMTVLTRLLEQHRSTLNWVALKEVVHDGDRRFPVDQCMVYDVFGGLWGWVSHPLKLYQLLRQARRQGVVYPYLGVVWHQRKRIVYLNADEGRLVRPLVILDDPQKVQEVVLHPLLSCAADPVTEWMNAGIIEYLDAEEESSGCVLIAPHWDAAAAVQFEQTHMEVHGCMALSPISSKAFVNYDQGPRRMYTANMENRTVSYKPQPDRGTTSSYSLLYGQIPLISEPVDQHMQLRQKNPVGTNATVVFKGMEENIEDAWNMKQAFVDRGACMTGDYHILIATHQKHRTFRKPPPAPLCKNRAIDEMYRGLDEDGCPIKGATLKGGYAWVGEVFHMNRSKKTTSAMRCVSQFLPANVVYKVYDVEKIFDPGQTQPKVIRVTLVRFHTPQVGDKFQVGHGQKGTLGRILRPEDMPQICTGPMAGIIPDLVLNPCSLARGTPGLVIEMMAAKARALHPSLIPQFENVFLTQTSFKARMRLIRHALKLSGLRSDGKARMLNGVTGEMYESPIFVGELHLRVLKHMSRDKLRARDNGPIHECTRQPTVGKKQYGALRVGEMEAETILSNGLANTLRDLMYVNAEKPVTEDVFCTKCQIRGIRRHETRFYDCHQCHEPANLVRINTAYIAHLSTQELNAAGLGHTFIVAKDEGYGDAYQWG